MARIRHSAANIGENDLIKQPSGAATRLLSGKVIDAPPDIVVNLSQAIGEVSVIGRTVG
jgi:hypothetical protein